MSEHGNSYQVVPFCETDTRPGSANGRSIVSVAPLYAMTLVDCNKDGNMDFIAAGNQSSIRIRMGVIDANFGQLFLGDGKGNFSYVPQAASGFSITGDTKSLQRVAVNGGEYLLIGTNNVGVLTYKLK